MATATPANHVTLTLTEDEAKTLRMILVYVGGSPTDSRRGDCDAITSALCSAGINWYPPDYSEDGPFTTESCGGPALMFKDRLETL